MGAVTLVTHLRNRGQSATLNEAIGLAATPLVTILNDDDWLMPHALSRAVGTLGANPELGLVGAASRWFSGPGRPPDSSGDGPTAVRIVAPAQVRSLRHPLDLNMTHSGMTISRVAWEVVGGYLTDAARRVVPWSDRDLQLRIAALYPVAVINEPLVWWRSDSSVDAGVNS